MRYLTNTLKLSIFGLLWGFPAPILLAFLLNRVLSTSLKQKIQLVLYLPNFISVIVLCGIVRILLSPTGLINMLLGTNWNFMTCPPPSAPSTLPLVFGKAQAGAPSSIPRLSPTLPRISRKLPLLMAPTSFSRSRPLSGLPSATPYSFSSS